MVDPIVPNSNSVPLTPIEKGQDKPATPEQIAAFEKAVVAQKIANDLKHAEKQRKQRKKEVERS